MTRTGIKRGVIPRKRYKSRIYQGLVTGERRDNYWFWYSWHSGRSKQRAHEIAKQLAGVQDLEYIQPDLFEDLAMRLGFDWVLAGGHIT